MDVATAVAVDTHLVVIHTVEDIPILVGVVVVIGIMADTVVMEDGVLALVSAGRGMASMIARTTTHHTTPTIITTIPRHQSCIVLLRLQRIHLAKPILTILGQNQTVRYPRHRFTKVLRDIQMRRPNDQLHLYNQCDRHNRWEWRM